MHRSKVHKMRGDFALAHADLNKVLSLKPDHKEAKNEVCPSVSNIPTIESAVGFSSSSSHSRPLMTHSTGHQINVISKCLGVEAAGEAYLQRHPHEARTQLTAALECAPESTALLMKRAEVLYTLGEHTDVIADTGYVLKQEKNNMRAYFLRGRAYYLMGEPDVAVR